MKSAFVGQKYIFLLTSHAYHFFNSLQLNGICICPFLILLPLKSKYPTNILALSFSRIAKSMLLLKLTFIIILEFCMHCLTKAKIETLHIFLNYLFIISFNFI